MTKEQEAQQAETIAEIREAAHGQGKYEPQSISEAKFMAKMAQKDRKTLLEIVDSQAQKIAEQEKELKLLRYVLDAEKTARIYEDGTGAAGEALFHARKELEEYDAKMTPEQTTDSKEVAR